MLKISTIISLVVAFLILAALLVVGFLARKKLKKILSTPLTKKIVRPIIAVFAILVLVVLPIASIICIVRAPDDYSYERASTVSRGFAPSGTECFWDDCTKSAVVEYRTGTFYYDASESDQAVRLMKKMRSKANLRSMSDAFTSTDVGKYYDKGTYLTPQADGSLKVEKKTEVHYVPEISTTNETYFYGCYCNEHDTVALETINKDIKGAFRTKNITYLLSKYGIGVWIGAFAVTGVIVTVGAIKKLKVDGKWYL